MKKQYNESMIGASLEASITDVKQDVVQVQAAVDGIQNNPKWFPYSTVYSSPDGSRWYCMPGEEDSVRLHLPSEQEKDAYIISAVHLTDYNGEARSINGLTKAGNASYEIIIDAEKTVGIKG